MRHPDLPDFYNTIRPHEALDDLSPMQAEDLHYHRPRLTAWATKPSLQTSRGGSVGGEFVRAAGVADEEGEAVFEAGGVVLVEVDGVDVIPQGEGGFVGSVRLGVGVTDLSRDAASG